MKTNKSFIEDFNNELWGHHFRIPAEIGNDFVDGNDRRVICTINELVTFHCALMPYGDSNYFINVNKEIRKELGISLGEEISYTLVKDKSTYGMPMPEEMDELLKIDDEADKYFHALTIGKQRTLLYQIAKPKSSATRLNKALGITEFLKFNKGVLDFKLLNQFLKDFNKI